ncbi:MAG: hypothetical protein IPP64_06350 [Bacteroidetes bacterium]|nr:hypothetical protein [Bacteroidota bacterium]
MKKLLLPISFCLIVFALIVACQNSKKTNDSVAVESKPAGTTAVAKDSTAVSGTAGGGKGINKDSLAPSGTGTAIIHPVPNQEKIDSIKKAKTKKEN